MKDDDVYSQIYDDYSKDSRNKNLGEELLKNSSYIFLYPDKGCLFMLVPSSFVLMEVHTMIAKEARGKQAIINSFKAIDWLFTNSRCEKIITHVPDFNKPAKIFTRKLGFKKIGVNTKSFKRDGVLHDQTLYGLEKENYICQQ